MIGRPDGKPLTTAWKHYTMDKSHGILRLLCPTQGDRLAVFALALCIIALHVIALLTR